jgi:hypothetical protein
MTTLFVVLCWLITQASLVVIGFALWRLEDKLDRLFQERKAGE